MFRSLIQEGAKEDDMDPEEIQLIPLLYGDDDEMRTRTRYGRRRRSTQLGQLCPTATPPFNDAREYLSGYKPSISLPPREEVERLLALTTPHHSPLTPLSSPLPQIPSPPPNSPTHIEIPESCLPLRKRVRFASPTPSPEVGESSAAGAARQDRPTIAREDLYGFIDMIDVPPRCSTSRELDYGIYGTGMIWMVPSMRLHRSGAVCNDFRLQSAESQETEGDYRVIGSDQRDRLGTKDIKMAPKRKTTRLNPDATPTPVTDTHTTTSVTNAQIQAMINEGVTAALAARDATRNGDDSHTSGTGARRPVQVARECTYPDFLKCQPLNFKGTEGVVELTQWFEKMESVYSISNCTVACQVKFSMYSLQGNALTWWNSHVKTTTPEAAHAMPWRTLKKMMTDKYCLRGEIKKLEFEM
ncbi:hypothetical protein Tco_0953307 [Tanacetum coccineum]|uniref:Reverse transcriptase domain-containing protein n=1 Tax=Tanacetum coccineum TaxID=301880 RepID=A0ABQ5DZJ2_9ASTR